MSLYLDEALLRLNLKFELLLKKRFCVLFSHSRNYCFCVLSELYRELFLVPYQSLQIVFVQVFEKNLIFSMTQFLHYDVVKVHIPSNLAEHSVLYACIF